MSNVNVPSPCLAAGLPALLTQEDQPPKVVGYVLGKMEGSKDDVVESQSQLSTAIPGWSTRTPRDRVVSTFGSGGGLATPRTGHVTSLAVLPGYRRCGAAKQLMDMLHDRVSALFRVGGLMFFIADVDSDAAGGVWGTAPGSALDRPCVVKRGSFTFAAVHFFFFCFLGCSESHHKNEVLCVSPQKRKTAVESQRQDRDRDRGRGGAWGQAVLFHDGTCLQTRLHSTSGGVEQGSSVALLSNEAH